MMIDVGVLLTCVFMLASCENLHRCCGSTILGATLVRIGTGIQFGMRTWATWMSEVHV